MIRDRLPSAYLEEVTEEQPKFPAKVCLETFSESDDFGSVNAQQTSFNVVPGAGAAHAVLRGSEEGGAGGPLAARQLFGQQLGALGVSVKDASQKQMLEALQRSRERLMMMRQRVAAERPIRNPDTPESEKVCSFALSSQHRFGPSLRNRPVPKFTPLPGHTPADNLPAQPPSSLLNISNPDVILEVPLVNSIRVPPLPQKNEENSSFSPKFKTMGFQPVPHGSCWTDQNCATGIEAFFSDSRSSPERNRETESRSSVQRLSQNQFLPQYSSRQVNRYVNFDASERLTTFLRNEVELKRNPELVKIIEMFHRFG